MGVGYFGVGFFVDLVYMVGFGGVVVVVVFEVRRLGFWEVSWGKILFFFLF